MQLISLFSGEGGFELAATWAGWDVVSTCEINPFCQHVLRYYWPDAYHHDNVKTLTSEIIKEKSRWDPRAATCLVGGFPCQPFSVAGQRKGTEDERHLWPEMFRIIRECKPKWIVGENVRGFVNWNEGMVFEQVCAELESEGYEVIPFILPAAGVGAPHRRDRVWFVGKNSNSNGRESEFGEKNLVSGNSGTLAQEIMSGYGPTMERLMATPQARDWKGQSGFKAQKDLTRDATRMTVASQMLPTPRKAMTGGVSEERKNDKFRNLESVLSDLLLPTPDCSDRRSANSKQQGLSNVVAGKASQLNPRFVAEMMGFPTDWLDLPFQKPSGETNPFTPTETP